MSHSPNPQMRGEGGRYAGMMWVLTCDGCGHECWNDGDKPEYARYVPDGWRINQDYSTHACPDCLSRAETGHTVGCLSVGEPDDCVSPGACSPPVQ